MPLTRAFYILPYNQGSGAATKKKKKKRQPKKPAQLRQPKSPTTNIPGRLEILYFSLQAPVEELKSCIKDAAILIGEQLFSLSILLLLLLLLFSYIYLWSAFKVWPMHYIVWHVTL